MKKVLLMSLAMFLFCHNSFAQFSSSSKVYCYRPVYQITDSGEKEPCNKEDLYFIVFGNKCLGAIKESYTKASQNYSDNSNYYYNKLSERIAHFEKQIQRGEEAIRQRGEGSNSNGYYRNTYYYPDESTANQIAYRERRVKGEGNYSQYTGNFYDSRVDRWIWEGDKFYFKTDRSMMVRPVVSKKIYYELFDMTELNLGHKSYEVF